MCWGVERRTPPPMPKRRPAARRPSPSSPPATASRTLAAPAHVPADPLTKVTVILPQSFRLDVETTILRYEPRVTLSSFTEAALRYLLAADDPQAVSRKYGAAAKRPNPGDRAKPKSN